MSLSDHTSDMSGEPFSVIAKRIAENLIFKLCRNTSIENFFDWRVIYGEIVDDLSKIGLQADSFYRGKNLQISTPDFVPFLYDMILRREEKLHIFFKKLVNAITKFSKFIDVEPKKITLKFLDADSHNQGERPVMFQLADRNYVLKFRDPRPYLVLKHVLQKLQSVLQIELAPPNIWSDSSNKWHVMPYIATDNQTSKIIEKNTFMTRLGAITAAAYFLEMTDIHLDNVLVHKGLPIIIDAECMFYGYEEYQGNSIEDRLWGTGLVGENTALSVIRGETTSISDFGAKEENGTIRYLQPSVCRMGHRLIDEFGVAVDPINYEASILHGFSKAYMALCDIKDRLRSEIEKIVSPDMQTRFLLRFTMHYATTIEMLRRPTIEDDAIRLGKLTSIFLNSGSMSTLMNDQAKRCELRDMLNSDFPLFWVEDKQNVPTLMHWSGSICALSENDTLQKRIQRATTDCTPYDLPRLSASLKEFLRRDV